MKIEDLPIEDNTPEPRYDVDLLLRRLAGIVLKKELHRFRDGGVIEMIYTLTHEISQLKSKIKELESKIDS